MQELKTLTVNDVAYDITDDGAVRFDSAQSLTDEQKAQARENIGAQLKLEAYSEKNGVGLLQNPSDSNNDIWSQWNNRLAFGMDTETAPVPFRIDGQLLADGTIIAHNSKSQAKNRWGFHVFEAYANDNYSRMTMLLDKHSSETDGKPSLEYYYYTGANHHADSYGNVKIGSDVVWHSFIFDRDKMTAYGEIDCKYPVTLARISLSNDLNTTYETVAEADAAYEPESNFHENVRCLKYIALKNAQSGAMFYDIDRHKPVIKVHGAWYDIPLTPITDASYDIFSDENSGDDEEQPVWDVGVLNPDGTVVVNTARLYTTNLLGTNLASISAADGYEFMLVVYGSDGGMLSGTAGEREMYYKHANRGCAGAATYQTYLDVSLAPFNNGELYRIIARRTDLTDIDPSEGENITITYNDVVSPNEIVWESGVIGGFGEAVENTARLRTVKFFANKVTTIVANDGYEFAVVFAAENGKIHNSYYDSTNNLSGNVCYRTSVDLTDVAFENFPHIKLIARRTDLADIAPSEGENIVVSFA